ncbi:hypothetical protein Mapa_013531 [Marchantia paleacea]|nr:hypothetical protein Mapa_013531 [Marchantia paleacea]
MSVCLQLGREGAAENSEPEIDELAATQYVICLQVLIRWHVRKCEAILECIAMSGLVPCVIVFCSDPRKVNLRKDGPPL